MNYDVANLKVDPSAVKQAWEANASHDPIGLTPFSGALSKAADLLSTFGPTIDVALRGSPKASGIFNGVISGFLNQGMGASFGGIGGGMSPLPSMGSTTVPSLGFGKAYSSGTVPSPSSTSSTINASPMGGKAYSSGLPGPPPGLGGGGGFPGGGGFGLPPGGGSPMGDVDGQINSLQSQQLELIAVQAKVGASTLMTQLVSQIEAKKQSAHETVMRNVGKS